MSNDLVILGLVGAGFLLINKKNNNSDKNLGLSTYKTGLPNKTNFSKAKSIAQVSGVMPSTTGVNSSANIQKNLNNLKKIINTQEKTNLQLKQQLNTTQNALQQELNKPRNKSQTPQIKKQVKQVNTSLGSGSSGFTVPTNNFDLQKNYLTMPKPSINNIVSSTSTIAKKPRVNPIISNYMLEKKGFIKPSTTVTTPNVFNVFNQAVNKTAGSFFNILGKLW